DGVAGRGGEHAAVGGLSAGGGIEHRAIEHDAASLGQADHGGAAVLEVGILAKQTVGGHGARATTIEVGYQALAYGILTFVRRSSHSGTGRPFSRRNCGA